METNTTIEKTEFTLAGNWEMDVMIKEVPYYKWMKEQGITNPNKIDTKIAYLASQGFNKEIHKLTNADEILKIMGYCEDMYFQWEILSKWKCQFCGSTERIAGRLADGSQYCERHDCNQKAIEKEILIKS